MASPKVQGAVAPSKLHRVNGFDASVTLLQSMASVRGGRWISGSDPASIVSELLEELRQRGYYLGVQDRDAS